MKYAGMVLIAIGLVDLIGSFTGFDLWGGFFGIHLPDLLWQFSAYIEIAAGYFIMNLGSGDQEAEEPAEVEEENTET